MIQSTAVYSTLSSVQCTCEVPQADPVGLDSVDFQEELLVGCLQKLQVLPHPVHVILNQNMLQYVICQLQFKSVGIFAISYLPVLTLIDFHFLKCILFDEIFLSILYRKELRSSWTQIHRNF